MPVAALVGQFPADDLVRVVPLVHWRSGDRDRRPFAVASKRVIDHPSQLQHVGRAPAGDLVKTGIRTVVVQPVHLGDVVVVASGGDVIKRVVRGEVVQALVIYIGISRTKRSARRRVVGTAG